MYADRFAAGLLAVFCSLSSLVFPNLMQGQSFAATSFAVFIGSLGFYLVFFLAKRTFLYIGMSRFRGTWLYVSFPERPTEDDFISFGLLRFHFDNG